MCFSTRNLFKEKTCRLYNPTDQVFIYLTLILATPQFGKWHISSTLQIPLMQHPATRQDETETSSSFSKSSGVYSVEISWQKNEKICVNKKHANVLHFDSLMLTVSLVISDTEKICCVQKHAARGDLFCVNLPETNIFAPEKWWLEKNRLSYWGPVTFLRGKLAVKLREGIWTETWFKCFIESQPLSWLETPTVLHTCCLHFSGCPDL